MAGDVKAMTQVASPPVSTAAKEISGDVARKVRQTAKRTMDDVAMTPFLRKITFFSSGGSFLDGYVLSLIGVALTQIVPAFGLTDDWSAAIGASVLVGIFAGTIAGGYLTDIIGRKKMFIIDLVAIGLFSLLSVFVAEAWQLVAARFFIGVFVGADYPIATSLIAEFTPKEHRSISMGMVSAAWYLGATVAAVVGYGLYGMKTVEMVARQRRGTLRGAAHRAARHPRIASVAGKQGARCRGSGRDGPSVRPRCGACSREAGGQDAAGNADARRVSQAHGISRGVHLVPGGAHVCHLHLRARDHDRLRAGRGP